MLGLEVLTGAVQRLIQGRSTDVDRSNLARGLLSGQVVHAGGARSIAIGGDANDTVVVTGDHAQIARFELSAEAYERIRLQLFPTPSGLPPPFPDLIFLGRERAVDDIKRLLGISAANQVTGPPVIVRGWPGVGKTTLVSFLSRDPDVAAAFPDGVLWCSLDQRPALVSMLAEWGNAVGNVDVLRASTPEEAAAKLRITLHKKRMLLIADDVWEQSHGSVFLKARAERCSLLFTTRLPAVADALAQDPRWAYHLDVLTEEHALKLMRVLAPEVVEAHTHECHELVRDLECLPLAIHVAAQLLRVEAKHGWGVGNLLEEIRTGAPIIQATAPADRMQDGHIPTVQVLLKKSTDLLDEETRTRFSYLGVFAPKPATFNIGAMTAVWQTQEPKPTVRKLVERGLLEVTQNGRFQMHALLVAHAKSLLQ